MNIPSDLPGGWEFNKPFQPNLIQVGQVWRKCGPLDAIKIVRVMLPGHPDYDGGAPGISVKNTSVSGCNVIWERKTWFKLGSLPQLHRWLEVHGYALASEGAATKWAS